jgi:N-acetylmuramoyl-L-alanine amidase CwlD
MRRSLVRAGSLAVAVVFAASMLAALPAAAQSQPVPAFWFAGTRLIFERPDRVDDEIAVRASDQGLVRFLARVGATISWQPSSRYVVVTTAERKTLTFTLGLPHFQTGSATQNAPLNAYLDGSDVFLPFLTLARALYVQPILQGNEYVLEPMLGGFEAREDGRKTIVTLRGATPLHFRKSLETSDRLTLVFAGTGSTLQPARRIDMPGLGQVDVTVTGTVRNPTTSVTFTTPAGGVRALLPSTAANEVVLAFGRGDVALGGVPIPSETDVTVAQQQQLPASSAAPATPLPVATTAPSALVSPSGNAFVTAVDLENPAPDALLLHVGVSAGVGFEWHRLGEDRFYIDLRNATLTFAPRDDRTTVPFVQSVRVRQIQTTPVPIVRVALTMTPNRRIDVVPDERGVTVTIADADAGHDFVAQVGTGQTGGPSAAMFASPATPSPSGPAAPPPGSNPRLIVIDPGHGGSDTGAMRNGLVEKDITLDIALRLRTLLVARGWIVKMTRDRDVDVYGPNASDVNELQARVDVANNAGARMFVSVHVNSSTSAAPNGTTTFYYKPEDRTLAAAIQRRLVPVLGTKDDGVQKERFYVIRHTTMPASLVETAFMSNSEDAARLRSPDFRQSVAQGIADGIKDYAGVPSGSVSQQ